MVLIRLDALSCCNLNEAGQDPTLPLTPICVFFASCVISESVRKRALIALKNFYTLDTDLILPYFDQIKDSLYDPEPSVMSAALGFFAIAVKVESKMLSFISTKKTKIDLQINEEGKGRYEH